MISITNKLISQTIQVNNSIRYYIGMGPLHGQVSGAYIFRPRNDTPEHFHVVKFSYADVSFI